MNTIFIWVSGSCFKKKKRRRRPHIGKTSHWVHWSGRNISTLWVIYIRSLLGRTDAGTLFPTVRFIWHNWDSFCWFPSIIGGNVLISSEISRDLWCLVAAMSVTIITKIIATIAHSQCDRHCARHILTRCLFQSLPQSWDMLFSPSYILKIDLWRAWVNYPESHGF